MMPEYTTGDIVTFCPYPGRTWTVRVTLAHEPDVHNGYPGFRGIVVGDSAALREPGTTLTGLDFEIVSVEPEPLRCRYADCVEQHPVAKGDCYAYGERITCSTCRRDLGLPPVQDADA